MKCWAFLPETESESVGQGPGIFTEPTPQIIFTHKASESLL